jgi:hypothetical protein
MKIGTKSVLFGVHQFAIHPWFVALAWWKLYGFPFDPRLWVAFFVHDLGYLGKPNMDGEEGETHPQLGARIMTRLFDCYQTRADWSHVGLVRKGAPTEWFGKWGQFALLHSRYYAKQAGLPFSRLCVADKLSFALTPRWLYLPMARATGELNEYLRNAQRSESDHWKPTGYDAKVWHAALCKYMRLWVAEHKDGRSDNWTSKDRNSSKTEESQ